MCSVHATVTCDVHPLPEESFVRLTNSPMRDISISVANDWKRNGNLCQ